MTTADIFFAALDAGDVTQIQALLAADPALANAQDASGVSPVRYAIYRGRRDLVQLVLAAGQPLDIFDAAVLGNSSRLRELLAGDTALARDFSGDGFTPLHYVVFFNGDLGSVRALLDAGADPNAVARNPQRVTALHSALAGHHDSAIVRLLVERGADVNARQERGATALMEAALQGDTEMIAFLLESGADPTLQADDGRTAADFAREAGIEFPA